MLKSTQVLHIFVLSLLHCITCNKFDDGRQNLISYLSAKMSLCSEYFQYQRIEDFINGKLELTNIKMGDTIKLTFNKLDYAQHPRFKGIFLPDESSEKVIDRIQNVQPIIYRVDFPITRRAPELLKIFINGNELCATKFNTSREILVMKHTLNVKNGSLPVFTHNIYIPNFVEAETTTRELTPLIYGGSEIIRGEYPWLTAIYKKQKSGLSFICGGSLLTTSFILTAAHCFQGTSLNAAKILVILGQHDLTNFEEETISIRQIKNLILHPEYKYGIGFSDADLALLEMKNVVSFTAFIKPICLWNKPANESFIVNHSGVVAGWGDDDKDMALTRVAKKVKMNIVSEAVCLRSSVTFKAITSARTLCAGNRDDTGPCEGDSGGGLMIYQNGHWMLRGIVSAGLLSQHRCNLREYTVYCDIAKHTLWLKNSINQNQTSKIGAICGKSDTEQHKQLTAMSVEDICGRSSMETSSEHPWLAAIYFKAYTGLKFTCTGALISTRSVLAPAHCFATADGNIIIPADFFRIFLGRYDLNNIQENGVVTRDVATFVFFPDFKFSNSIFQKNDLVLIQMKTAVSFTEFVMPICLWSEPQNEQTQVLQQSATLSSWSYFDVYDESITVPTSVKVNLTSIRQCTSYGYNESLSALLVCIPRWEDEKGAMLMIKRNDTWLLRGINSLNKNFDTFMSKEFFVFSDIAEYLPWIRKNMLT